MPPRRPHSRRAATTSSFPRSHRIRCRWQWAATGDHFQLRARHSGKCLDVVDAGTGDGADIQQYACTGALSSWTRTSRRRFCGAACPKRPASCPSDG
ncbi:RICIN domain-containing protein [Micromonospora sp. DH13]|uniref:RICIN domain-containing protein n=1 Tax=Micromonospora sp. DH13 TaxID=2857013 RepID=UPI00098D28C0|nr:RICIN domain-containing protein [Micromonospora sp. DH13]